MDCYCPFTDCGGLTTEPAVNAQLSAPKWHLQFNGADNEVRIQELAIGQRGSLGAVIRNRWWNGTEDGRYSLLWHARALTIRGNRGAVRDLAAYVARKYWTDSSRQPVRPLDKGLRLTIRGVAGCEEEINALVEHFGAVRVDGREVMSRRRRLANCNRREKTLWPLRAEVQGRRQALGEIEGLLARKQRVVQRARLRLREARGRLDALVRLAQ